MNPSPISNRFSYFSIFCLISHKKFGFDFKLANTPIVILDTKHFFGIIIDKHFSRSKQIEKLSSKLLSSLYVHSRIEFTTCTLRI